MSTTAKIRRADGRPSVCLAMIVKNETAVIERCLRSIRPFIDAWAIVDTGSTDGTQDLVRRLMADVPGELIERPWVDFSTNRNQSLAAAHNWADYSFTIDADETLTAEPGFAFPILSASAYRIIVRPNNSEFTYERTQIARAQSGWRYKGVLHEALICDGPHTLATIGGLTITTFYDGARNQVDGRVKYSRDAELLERALRDEPDNARYRFYLAQSYKDAGEPEKAAATYLARADMGGWGEEVFYALFKAGQLLLDLNRVAEGTGALLRAYSTRPTRAESLVALARHHRLRQEWPLAYLYAAAAAAMPRPADILFVDESVYRWRATDELALAAYYTGRFQEAFAANERLLAQPLSPEHRDRIAANQAYAIAQLK